jgi:putative membrane protein
VIINDNLSQISAGGPLVLGGVNGIADGLAALAAGGTPLASGANTLAGGANELASGVNTFSSGMSQFAAGTPALAEGATKLAEGADGAATGTESLADGLGQAAEGVPNYSESERETLARSALTPVVATGNGDELFNAAGVPLFTGIALWAGGLATFLILSPLWRRTRTAARGLSAITLRSAFPGILAGAAQGALVGIAMPLALDLDGAQFTGFLSLGIVTGIAFALLNQGLAALLGGFGRFVSFIVLVVAFAGGIVSTAPEALRTIGDATPIGAAFSGFQSIASGASGAGSSATMLVLWGLIGLALTAFAAARTRKTGRAPVGDTADAASVTDQSLLPV